MYREQDAQRYASLIVNQGVRLQQGQAMILRAQVDCVDFVRLVAQEAYLAGASEVVVFYSDQQLDRMRYQHAAQEVLDNPADWQVRVITEMLEKGACTVSFTSADPDGFLGLDMGRVGRALNAQKIISKPFREQIDKKENQWIIVGVPSVGWAKKIFPDDTAEQAVEKLWDAIYHAMRLDQEDAAAAWEAHNTAIQQRRQLLNESGVVTLKITSGLGTDLTLDLVDHVVWEGGAGTTVGGVLFHPNMPTEEVFTAPHRARVNGRVCSSMPLNYQGTLIDGMTFTFQDGLVVDHDARQGKEALDLMLAVDEGCRRLGEVALVPYGSLIQEAGILFYNTLFDENASCHLALGSAYVSASQGALDLSRAQRLERGLNESVSHVDFMFGTQDLSVVGIRADGTTLQIFENGQWAF